MTRQTARSIDTSPYWVDAPLPRFPALDRDEHVDVLIVGGGITGLTAAYLLTSAGRSVAVIERERCALVDTGHTSAHLTMVVDKRLSDLVSSFGTHHAEAVWDAGLAAIAQIDTIVRAHDIDCDFAWVPGYIHAPLGSADRHDPSSFEREAQAATDLGFDATFVADTPLVGGPGVRYENQARFHPRKYLAALARIVSDRGGLIFEHTDAQEFGDAPLKVTTSGGTITCGDIVIASHTPLVGVRNLVGATLFQTKLALYTSYVVAGRVASGTVPDALFWDTADPYHYLRLETHRGYDVVIFGGEDHKTGQVEDTRACYDRLERTLTSIVPGIDITHRWSGQVIETHDGLPFIGESADHQFAGTGYAGNGMTFGTLTAMMAADSILELTNPWADLFGVERKSMRAGLWDYVKENADYPYYLVRDRFAGAQGKSLREIPRGAGRILELDGQTVAAYRDRDGRAIVRSATCTHMGCLVAWNDAERTWDCPCHGSRFKPDGHVIAGPAESPLADPKEST